MQSQPALRAALVRPDRAGLTAESEGPLAEMEGAWAATPERAFAGADAALAATGWEDLLLIDWPALAQGIHNPTLIDGRNALKLQNLNGDEFLCIGVGI